MKNGRPSRLPTLPRPSTAVPDGTPTAVPRPRFAPPPRPPADLVRTAVPSDRSFVLDLQRRFSNQLGFLPAAAIDVLLAQRRILLGLENGTPAGYVIARPQLRCMTAVSPIVQTAVCLDARRRRLGLMLVDAVAQDAWVDGRLAVQCWCREDLEACDFWAAAGFLPVADRDPENARRKRMVLYRRPLPGCSNETLTAVPRNAGFRGATIDRIAPAQLMLFGQGVGLPSLPDVMRQDGRSGRRR